jgi:uncharacterized membrane protein
VSDQTGYLFVSLIVGLLTLLGFGRLPRRRDRSAESILKRRYARGSLSRREYEDELDELRR